jgi:uncharacterized protein (DUF2235 family)
MPKKLIVCADGTWNTDNDKDQGHPKITNVARVAGALLPTDRQGIPQLVHYERGVGTDIGIRIRGGSLGRGLFQNVVDAYRFLVHNYEPGDRVYLFGFSRGAYTVRSLAGLIRNSGILKRGQESFEEEAVALYRDYDPETAPDGAKSIQFRADHSHDVDVEFIGVWDTVGALGIPGLDGRFRLLKGLDWQFHDVTLSGRVKNAFHALAIHEHRTDFVPTLWEQKPGSVGKQNFEQAWFSGAHSDVGGGYQEAGLSDVALEWMVHRAKNHGKLEFDEVALNLRPDAEAAGHDSFGTFFKVLDWFRGKGDGTLRQFRLNPTAATAESVHESVLRRFRAKPNEKWPETFHKELKSQSSIATL